MEETKRLQAIVGGRGTDDVYPQASGESSLRAFLQSFVDVVGLRGNREYAALVLNDLQLTLTDAGDYDLARYVGSLELQARRDAQKSAGRPLVSIGQAGDVIGEGGRKTIVNNSNVNPTINNID